MLRKKATNDYKDSSGNIFADLELPHPEQELLKARLTLQIYRIVKAQQLACRSLERDAGIWSGHHDRLSPVQARA